MFVSTASPISFSPGILPTASASRLGVGMIVGQPLDVMLERVQRAGRDDAGLPHAAAEQLAIRRAFLICSFGPASAEPTGAPSPLLKQTLTVSKCCAQSRASMPVATTALNSRAPSRCVRSPLACAQSQIDSTTSYG